MYRNEGISEPTLRKHFRRELDTSLLNVKALAMSKVVAAVNAGEAWAVCFFLKCKGGWRETTVLASDKTDPIRVTIETVGAPAVEAPTYDAKAEQLD